MHMRMYTRGHQTMVTEMNKTVIFWGRFIYNMVTLHSNPIHRYNVFQLTSFFEPG